MSRVLIDLRQWNNKGFTGVGQVAKNATLAMLGESPATEFVIIAHPDVLQKIDSDNVIKHPSFIELSQHPRNEWFEQIQLPTLCSKYKVDRYLSFENRTPVLARVFKATWFHDASIYRFPDSHPRKYIALLRLNTFLSCRSADHFFTPSEFSKRECETLLNVPGSCISVAPLGDSQLPIEPRSADEKPFFLCVGATNPRKNLPTLIKAFSLFKKNHVSPFRLVITGSSIEWERISSELNPGPDVEFIGHVSDEQLSSLYSRCYAAIFPSLYEGFGIPLLDAYRAGVPFRASNIPAHQELIQSDDCWFNPNSTDDIAHSLQCISQNPHGHAHIKQDFSWKRCAQAMLRVLA